MPRTPNIADDALQNRKMSDLVQGFIGLLSPDGTLLDVNLSAIKFAGVLHSDVIGEPLWEAPWWRNNPKSQMALKEAIRKGAVGEASRFEASHTGKGGRVIVVDFLLTPKFDDNGTVVALVPEARDITKIKEITDAIQESELRLRLACDAANIGTWKWNLNNDRLHWDDLQFRLFGIRRGNGHTDGERALSTIHSDDLDRVIAAIAASVEGDVPFREEFRVVIKGGDVRWIFGSGRTLRDEVSGKSTTMIGVNYDITEQKALESRLAQSNMDLEARVAERTRQLEHEIQERQRANEALAHAHRLDLIGQLAAGVAHDFNNLLAVIGGNLELAEMQMADNGDNRIEELIRDSLEAVEAGASLNRRLLSFARKSSLKPTEVNVNERIENAQQLFKRTLDDNIACQTTLMPGIWEVLADAGELDSAILNLVVNARDAMPEGGELSIVTRNQSLGDDDVRFAPDVEAGEFIQLAVSDTGTGMSPELMEKAVAPFFTTKVAGKGSGLGLSQVFGFARQSGGFATIDSVEGEGTTVRINLPCAVPAANGALNNSAKEYLPLGQGELVLLVEDNNAVRKISNERLVALGYTVLEASTATEAINVLRTQNTVSLILSDIRMPGELSGYDLATWARDNRPDIKVLLTSGDSFLEVECQQGILDQSVKMLPKPYSMQKLAIALHEVLASGK